MSDPSKTAVSGIIWSKASTITLLFYVVMAAAIYVANIKSPSGPCNPGMGFILTLFLPVISLILLLVNFVSVIKGRKSQIIPIVMHLVALIVIAILWFRPG